MYCFPGLLFQSILNALQQRNPRTEKSATVDPGEPTVSSSQIERNNEDLEETWKDSLSSTRKKINQTWEQYSPGLKNKVQRYSPSPLKKLKNLFTLTEEKDLIYDADEMEGDKEAGDVSSSNGRDLDISSSSIVKDVDNLENCSSQMVKAPSEASASVGSEYCSLGPSRANEKKSVDHNPPCIILQEADPCGSDLKGEQAHQEQLQRRKSPLTVQEWVDHLPIKNKIT